MVLWDVSCLPSPPGFTSDAVACRLRFAWPSEAQNTFQMLLGFACLLRAGGGMLQRARFIESCPITLTGLILWGFDYFVSVFPMYCAPAVGHAAGIGAGAARGLLW